MPRLLLLVLVLVRGVARGGRLPLASLALAGLLAGRAWLGRGGAAGWEGERP